MKFFKVYLHLLLPLFCLSSWAQLSQQECTHIDIRDRMSPDLRSHFSTPRNQGEIGWCYGFTAADMLSVEVGVPVSATHTATSD